MLFFDKYSLLHFKNYSESVVVDVDGHGNKDEGWSEDEDEVGDGENNNGEGDCGEVENKDEEGDGGNKNGEEILSEDHPVFFALNIEREVLAYFSMHWCSQVLYHLLSMSFFMFP